MRVRKKPWAAAELSGNDRFLNDPPSRKGSWREWAGGRPLHAELGCGKGRFVSQMAVNHPEICFAALERDPTIAAAAARKAREQNSPVTFVIGDVSGIETWLAPGEVSRFYINFCDPWPKKKWAKRRLTHGAFLAVYRRLLRPGGDLHFKTDNRELFTFSLEQFAQNGWGLRQVSLDLHGTGAVRDVMTEYEERFSFQGLPIFRLEAYPLTGLSEQAAREDSADNESLS